MEKIRLQKFFTDSGIMSRRRCEDAIVGGRITVNGIAASLGDRVDPETDTVALDGAAVTYSGGIGRTYIMLNKPMGYVTTLSDEQGRKNVSSLVEGCGKRVYPVGRLDMYSEGLLLLTDDGDLANTLTHPAAGSEKVYRLTVKGDRGEEFAEAMRSPMELDGYRLRPVGCTFIGAGEMTKDAKESSVYEVVLREGRNRQIRRMCEIIGVKVVRLERIAEGTIRLGDLPRGQWRYLDDGEIAALKAIKPKK